MEVKIECRCGAKYRFPVEPVNGQVGNPVNCPKCGADWTPMVNDSIRQQLSAPAPAANAGGSAIAAAANPVASKAVAATSAPASTTSSKPAIRIHGVARTTKPAAAPAAAAGPSDDVPMAALVIEDSPAPTSAARPGKRKGFWRSLF